MSKLLAPNGKPSNLTAEQYKLVRTPAFKKWFGNWESKLFLKNHKKTSEIYPYNTLSLDENGEPRVWHRASYEEYNKIESKYIYLGSKKSYVKQYGKPKDFFLKANKTIFIDNEEIERDKLGIKFDFLTEYICQENEGLLAKGVNYQKLKKIFKNQEDVLSVWEYFTVVGNEDVLELFNAWFKEYGFDSLMYWETGKKNNFGKYPVGLICLYFGDEYLKLADGTNTNFDGSNPDIRFKDGGEVFNNLSEKSKEIIDANYEGRGSFGFYDFDWNKESERENFGEWLKDFKENQFKKNLSKVIKQVESDIKLKNEQEKSEIKLNYFEELIIPSLGNEVLIPKLSIYEKQVLLDPNATIESIQKGFIDAKNIINEDGSINQSKITPSNFIVDDEINLPAFEKFVEKNPQYKGVFNDWKKILDEYMNISLKQTYAFRYPSVDNLEYLHSELVELKNKKLKDKFNTGGEVSNTNIIAQVWEWFGIKF